MTQITEVTAATRAVTVSMEFLVTRKQDGVPRGVHLALKESTVTKVNTKISLRTRVHVYIVRILTNCFKNVIHVIN